MSERTYNILLWVVWLSFLAFMSVRFTPVWGLLLIIMHPTNPSKK